MQDVSQENLRCINYNHSIDLLKFIGSIMIFTMHISAFRDFEQLSFVFELLTRWAVPFYFVCSAYFLFSKGKNGNITKTDLKKYIKRIAMLYLCWFIINLPSVIACVFYSHNIFNWKVWFCFFRDLVLSSSFSGSWYLVSCMFSAVFVYMLSKRMRTVTVLVIAFCIQTFCIFTSVYAGVLPPILDDVLFEMNFPLNIFGGVVYFAMGKFIFEKEYLFKNLSLFSCVMLTVLFYELYVGEIFLAKTFGIYGGSDEAFCLIPVSLFLFLGCQKACFQINHSRDLRKMSTVIYCCQGNVLVFVPKFLEICGVNASLARLLLGGLCVAVIVAVVFALQKSKKLKWAKYLT